MGTREALRKRRFQLGNEFCNAGESELLGDITEIHIHAYSHSKSNLKVNNLYIKKYIQTKGPAVCQLPQ